MRRWWISRSQAANASGQDQSLLHAGKGWAQCSCRVSGPRRASIRSGCRARAGGQVPTRATCKPCRSSSWRKAASWSLRIRRSSSAWTGAGSPANRKNWPSSCSRRPSQPGTSVGAGPRGWRRRSSEAPRPRPAKVRPEAMGRWLNRSSPSRANQPASPVPIAGSQGLRVLGMAWRTMANPSSWGMVTGGVNGAGQADASLAQLETLRRRQMPIAWARVGGLPCQLQE